jgi:YHS domain-containing protein
MERREWPDVDNGTRSLSSFLFDEFKRKRCNGKPISKLRSKGGRQMFKKFAVVAVVLVAVLMVAGLAMAQDEAKKAESPFVAAAKTETPAAPVVVGNKVCPVSGMAIAAEDMGKNTVEFEGKVYNVCSAACKDDFMKDPKANVAKVEEEMAKEVAPAEAK